MAQFTTEKIRELGGNVVTLSDSSSYIYDEKGIDRDKLNYGPAKAGSVSGLEMAQNSMRISWPREEADQGLV